MLGQQTDLIPFGVRPAVLLHQHMVHARCDRERVGTRDVFSATDALRRRNSSCSASLSSTRDDGVSLCLSRAKRRRASLVISRAFRSESLHVSM